jgi:hypothetical protein
MLDLLYVLILTAFAGLSVGLVFLCEHLMGGNR